MIRLTHVRLVVLLVSACLLSGCGKVEGPVITGSVKLDGQPLPGAQVQFVPKTDPKLGTASVATDNQGDFKVQPDAHRNNLLQPGTYDVLITKIEVKGGTDQPGGGMGSVVSVVPLEYTDASRTPLSVEVKQGENKLAPFELQSSKKK